MSQKTINQENDKVLAETVVKFAEQLNDAVRNAREAGIEVVMELADGSKNCTPRTALVEVRMIRYNSLGRLFVKTKKSDPFI